MAKVSKWRMMRYNATMTAKRLVFWKSTAGAIEQLLILAHDCLSSDVALGCGVGESSALNDDDVFGGVDTLVDIAAKMKMPCSPNDFLPELLRVHGAPLRSLDEQGRRVSAISNDNAQNKFTSSADVIFDRP